MKCFGMKSFGNIKTFSKTTFRSIQNCGSKYIVKPVVYGYVRVPFCEMAPKVSKSIGFISKNQLRFTTVPNVKTLVKRRYGASEQLLKYLTTPIATMDSDRP